MKKVLFSLLVSLMMPFTAQAADGMINVRSSFNVAETADRLEAVLQQKGMKLLNRIAHSAGANQIGIELRDTELLIFGNPKVGSPLMKCQQTVAIDLPQKALIWQDENANVWISYNNPLYLKQRHNISGCDQLLSKVAKALSAIANSAALK